MTKEPKYKIGDVLIYRQRFSTRIAEPIRVTVTSISLSNEVTEYSELLYHVTFGEHGYAVAWESELSPLEETKVE